MNKRVKRKAKDMIMNIYNIITLRSRQIVWIYTSSTLILGLAKERKNKSINTTIITDKDKIKVIQLYKGKQLRIRKTQLKLGSFYNSGIYIL